ncbi:hypothetical protein MKEN_00415100 [Mycena kentingensis (nom. inval.)]|nr:hypothetical protein MKEN_00415100 [Mycena kentingensis (nom. inval.)]
MSSSPTDADSRRHHCDHCNKPFLTSGHLARHLRTHTGERAHACTFPGCTTRCSRKDNLAQHYRLHFDIRDLEALRNREPHKKRRKTRVQRVGDADGGAAAACGQGRRGIPPIRGGGGAIDFELYGSRPASAGSSTSRSSSPRSTRRTTSGAINLHAPYPSAHTPSDDEYSLPADTPSATQSRQWGASDADALNFFPGPESQGTNGLGFAVSNKAPFEYQQPARSHPPADDLLWTAVDRRRNPSDVFNSSPVNIAVAGSAYSAFPNAAGEMFFSSPASSISSSSSPSPSTSYCSSSTSSTSNEVSCSYGYPPNFAGPIHRPQASAALYAATMALAEPPAPRHTRRSPPLPLSHPQTFGTHMPMSTCRSSPRGLLDMHISDVRSPDSSMEQQQHPYGLATGSMRGWAEYGYA